MEVTMTASPQNTAPRHQRRAVAEPEKAAAARHLVAAWARGDDDMHASQGLRWRVNAARANGPHSLSAEASTRRDTDLFDGHGEHLLVHAIGNSDNPPQLVGSCRVLMPDAAKRVGGYSCDISFDLVRLARLRPRLAELGHACVDPDWRHTQVAKLLWLQVGSFLLRNDIEHLMVCTPLPMADGGRLAANVWNEVRRSHLAPIEDQVRPRLPLPVEQLATEAAVELPLVVRSLLRCGARLLGPPAWNATRGVAELPWMIRQQHLPARFRERFAQT